MHAGSALARPGAGSVRHPPGGLNTLLEISSPWYQNLRKTKYFQDFSPWYQNLRKTKYFQDFSKETAIGREQRLIRMSVSTYEASRSKTSYKPVLLWRR